MIDFIQLPSTIHAYSGGNVGTGPESIDGNFDTYYGGAGTDGASGSGGSFAGGTTVLSTHTFDVKRTIKELKFRVFGTASSNSSTDNGAHVTWYIQYQVEGDSTWYTFSSQTGTSGSNSGGGSNSASIDTGVVDVTGLAVANVVAVRASISNSGSFHNSNGSHTWDVRVEELQAFGDAGGFATLI